MSAAAASSSSPSSIFSGKHSRPPEDTVFVSIFPDFTVLPTASPPTISEYLQSLHIQVLQAISPLTSNYIWQHEPFSLSPSPLSSAAPPHLHGKLRFGDNLEDEWFVVFLLFEISRSFPQLSIRVWDSDGEFLLIETAFFLPRWLNPDTAANRVFIRRGRLRIIPNTSFPDPPSLNDALAYLIKEESAAPEQVQHHLDQKLREYPDRAYKNVHRVRIRVPLSVAQVLKHEPCLISLAVEGFYDRDIDTMKYAARMERFLNSKEEELVQVVVKMSRAMYAQLVRQTFQPPKCYPALPPRSDVVAYTEAELGVKIACGFEMMYQVRKRQGEEGKGSTWEAFKESLDRSGYFQGLLPGSMEYRRLLQNAEDYYRKSSLHSRASEILSAPVHRIDEILSLPYSADDFKGQELPRSDDDSWLYGAEDELNAALQERQKEMEQYNQKHKKKQKSKEQQSEGPSPSNNLDDYDLGNISKSMQAFVTKMSSFEGAEVLGDGSLKNIEFDVDRFMKDMESAMKHQGSEDTGSEVDIEEGSSSDMDFDESEDESDIGEPSEEKNEAFMRSYSEALEGELRGSTLTETFVRATELPMTNNEGTSKATENMGEELTPVDVDFNLVKNLLDSFSSQQGLPGPASNILGLMGLQLPQDDANSKSK